MNKIAYFVLVVLMSGSAYAGVCKPGKSAQWQQDGYLCDGVLWYATQTECQFACDPATQGTPDILRKINATEGEPIKSGSGEAPSPAKDHNGDRMDDI